MTTDASRVINNLGPLYWVGLFWHWKIPTWVVLGEANYIILKKKAVRKKRCRVREPLTNHRARNKLAMLLMFHWLILHEGFGGN